MPEESPGTPVLRADATDDLDEIEAEVAGITDEEIKVKFRKLAEGPVQEFAKGGLARRLICAVCGLAAGTCGHQSSMTTEVPE